MALGQLYHIVISLAIESEHRDKKLAEKGLSSISGDSLSRLLYVSRNNLRYCTISLFIVSKRRDYNTLESRVLENSH